MCIIAISCVHIFNRKVDNRMDRQSFTDLIQTKIKMVRIEAGYTQDTMAKQLDFLVKALYRNPKRESITKLDNLYFNLCIIQRL